MHPIFPQPLRLLGALAALVLGNLATYAGVLFLAARERDYDLPPDMGPTRLLMVFGFAAAALLTAWLVTAATPWFTPERWPQTRRFVFAAAALLFAVALHARPIGSADNAWNLLMARGVALHGVNPYLTPAQDLHRDPVFALTSPAWADAAMCYGPVWTGAAVLPIWLTSNVEAQALGLRLLNALGYVAAGVILARFLRCARGAAEANALLTFWLLNPVALFELVNAGHNEGLLLPFMAFAAVGLAKARLVTAAAGIVGAMLIKNWPAILLPALLAFKDSWRKKLLVAVASAAAITVAWAPFWAGWATLEPLQRIAMHTRADYFFSPIRYLFLMGAQLLQFATPNKTAEWASFLCFGLIAIGATVLGWRKKIPPLTVAMVIGGAYHLVWLNWFQPWYLLALLPFAVVTLETRRAVWFMAIIGATAMLTYIIAVPFALSICALAIIGSHRWLGRSA